MSVLSTAALMIVPVTAEPDRASFLLGSAHPGATRGFEEFNPGVFLSWEDRGLHLDYSVGAFRNSYGKVAVAAFAGLPLARWPDGQLSLIGGIAHYPGNGRNFSVHAGDFIPLVGLQVRHKSAFVQVLPKGDLAAVGVISFGATFDLEY